MSALFLLVAASLASVSPAKASQATAQAAPSKSVQEPDSLFYKTVVAKGQTLSWIGLRHLGAWTPEIAQRVIADNPGLRSGAPKEGTELRLRRNLDRRALSPAQQVSLASRRAVATRTLGIVDRIASDGSIHPLVADEFLSPGDRIRTGPGGVAELIIDNQSILRLRENSQIAFVAIQDSTRLKDRQAGTRVSLDLGRVWVKVRKWAGPLVGFEVRLPTAVAGVHGTIFECTVRADSSGEVSVLEGLVGVVGGHARTETKVPAGQRVELSPKGDVSPTAPFGQQPDPAESPDPSEEALRSLQDDIQQASSQAKTKDLSAAQTPIEYCRPARSK
jgi:hypothetical protein